MKTVNFRELVARGGKPEMHLTWSEPGSDEKLQKAAKQHRVVTLYPQMRGSKKDYGVVELEPAPQAQYLIFPKSIQRLAERRVVGVRYDLIADGSPSDGKPPLPRFPRKSPPTKTGQKVIPFKPLPVRLKEQPHQGEKRAHPKHVEVSKTADPFQSEVEEAIHDLEGGQADKARRRLERLLRKMPPP